MYVEEVIPSDFHNGAPAFFPSLAASSAGSTRLLPSSWCAEACSCSYFLRGPYIGRLSSAGDTSFRSAGGKQAREYAPKKNPSRNKTGPK